MLSKDSDLMERAFKIFNEVYFENCLPEVVITIQSKPRAYGYITTVPVWKEDNTYFYEINSKRQIRTCSEIYGVLL